MTIRQYNGFLKSAKRAYGITHRAAQQMYRGLKDRLERQPTRADLKNHPRISKQEATRAAAPKPKPRAKPGPKAASRSVTPKAGKTKAVSRTAGDATGGGSNGGGGGGGGGSRSAKAEDELDFYDLYDFDEGDYYEIEDHDNYGGTE